MLNDSTGFPAPNDNKPAADDGRCKAEVYCGDLKCTIRCTSKRDVHNTHTTANVAIARTVVNHDLKQKKREMTIHMHCSIFHRQSTHSQGNLHTTTKTVWVWAETSALEPGSGHVASRKQGCQGRSLTWGNPALHWLHWTHQILNSA